MSGLATELEIARRAALAAAVPVMRAFRTEQEVVHKSPDQPLTAADLAANDALHAILLGERPEYGWLSEETADTPERLRRRRVWVVDPIDGTRSFIQGYAEFAISIGLVEDGRALVGVVLNPATGELFEAIRGGGARLRREEITGGAPAEPTPIHVSRGGDSDAGTILASRTELRDGELDVFRPDWRIAEVGSTAYKLARVASGEGDVFVSRAPKSEWDVCAGALIVEEAGGRATDLNGNELVYNREDPRVYGIVATNGALHERILRAVAEMPPASRLAGWPGEPKR